MSQISQAILEQLGGSKFRAMTGVKNFIRSNNSISMHLPNTKNKIKAKYFTVFLDADETYRLRFQKRNLEIIDDISGIPAEHLQAVFTNTTGLHTHL